MDNSLKYIPQSFPSGIDVSRVLKDFPVRVYTKDLSGNFTGANPETLRAHGVETIEELLNTTDFKWFDDAHAKEAAKDEAEIIRTGKPIIRKRETEIWKHDGRVVQVLSSKFPLLDADGRTVIGIIGVSEDVTDAINAEEIMRGIFDLLPQCVFVKDRKGIIIHFNKSFEEWHRKLGITKLRGKTDKDLWPNHPELVATFRKGDEFVLSTGQVYGPKTEQHISADGQVIEIMTTKFPRMTAQGIVGLIGIYHNVTEAERRQRKAFSEEISRKLAHSIRTSVDIALGNLELAMKKHGRSPVLDRAHKVMAEVHRFVRLMGDVPAMTRIGKTEHTSAVRLLRDLQEIMSVTCSLDVKAPTDDFLIECCPGLINMALRELLTNGQRFAKSAIEISIQKETSDEYSIHVRDDGPGLHPSLRGGKAFEMSVTTDPGNHTGLGLTFVQQIAEFHRGTVTETGLPGEGAHFVMTLPTKPKLLVN